MGSKAPKDNDSVIPETRKSCNAIAVTRTTFSVAHPSGKALMNAVYKLIWNIATGTWAVAPEIAAARGKKSRTRLAAAMAVALVMPAGAALAADSPDALQCAAGQSLSQDGLRCEAAPTIAPMSGSIGVQAALDDALIKVNAGSVSSPATATGSAAIAIGFASQATDAYGVALGSGTNAAGRATAIGVDSQAVGVGSAAFGNAAKANTASSVAIGASSSATAVNSVAIGALSLADRANSVSVGAAAAGQQRQITNMAAGTAATDAVNLSQLTPVVAGLGGGAQINPTTGVVTGPTYNFGTNGSYNDVGGALGNLDTRVNGIAAGAGLVTRDAPTGNIHVGAGVTGGTVSLRDGNDDSRLLTGVKAGIGNTDAVNVSQLKPVLDGLGGGATVNPDGTITGPTYTVGGSPVNNVGDALTNIDGRTTTNTTNIAGNTTAITNLTNGTVGIVQQAAAGANLTVGKDNDGAAVDFTNNAAASRKLIGVANGAVDATSNEAINGSQLYGTAKSVADGLGGGATVNPDGTISAPSYSVGGTTATNVGDAITNIDGRTTTNTTAITNLTNGTVGIVQQAAAGANLTVGKDNDGAAVDFTNNAAASRKLVGVANGTVDATSNEAINGSQLFDTNTNVATNTTAISNLDGRVTTNEGNITTINTRLDGLADGTVGLVTYDDASGTVKVAAAKGGSTVDFAGVDATGVATARTLTNVAAGAVSATSAEAVNGSQLHGTAQSVADGLGGGSVVNTDGTISAPSYSVGGTTTNNVGDALSNIDGRVTTNTGDISDLKDSLADGTVGLVTYDDASGTVKVAAAKGGTTVDFAGVDATGVATARKLTSVAAGDLSATSSDAVNGSQLFDTNTNVATNTTDISNLDGRVTTNEGNITNLDGRVTTNEGNITTINTRLDGLADGTVGLVTYDDASGTVKVAGAKGGSTVDFAGVDANGVATARKLTNVAAGGVSATSSDAINGAQLHGTAQSVADGLGGGSVVNTDGTISAPSYSVGGTTVTNVGDAITNIDGRTTTNTTDITDLRNSIGDGTVGLVTYDTAAGKVNVASAKGGSTVDFAGTDGVRTLTSVGAGGVSATSTDAVNGSQLHGTAQSVADGLGGGSVVNADGTLSAPSYTVGGTTVTNVGDALTNIDGRVITNTGDITNLTSVVNDLSTGAAGLVTMDPTTGNVNMAAAQGGTAVNMGGTAGARRLAGVANGVADDEAATVAQLKASGLVDPNDGRALGAVVYDDISLGRATLGGTGGTVLGNVGNGLIGAGSMEAINGGQLFQMNADWESKWSALDGRVGTIERGVADGSIGGPGQGAGPGPVPGDGMIGAGDGAGSIVIGDGTPGGAGAAGGDGAVAIGGGSSAAGKDSVAIGSGSIADRDREVSVGAPGAERVIGNVAAGTRPTDAVNLKQMDDRFAAERDWSNSRFQAVDKRIDRMGAISAAYAGMAINTAGLNGDNRVGAGIGSQNGRSALAVGYQRILGEKKNVSVSLGGAFSGSDQSVSAGAGFSW